MWEATVLRTTIFTSYGTVFILQRNFVYVEGQDENNSQNIKKTLFLKHRFPDLKEKLLPVITARITSSLHNTRQHMIVLHKSFLTHTYASLTCLYFHWFNKHGTLINYAKINIFDRFNLWYSLQKEAII